MPTPPLILSSVIPSGSPIVAFDHVVHDGRTLFVCADFGGRVFSWEPVTDVWCEHELDNPFGEDAEEHLGAELEGFGAVVADGRVVVGGGGQHQSFAQWDLETGAVRVFANEWDPGPQVVVGADLDGTAVLLTGDDCGRVALWDASETATIDETGEYENPEPTMLEGGNQDGTLGVLSQARDGRLVVVAHTNTGGVTVWSVDDREPTARFPPVPAPARGLAWATIDGRRSVVVPSGRESMLFGDPATGRWSGAIGDPGSETEDDRHVGCLDVIEVDGVPLAVTGAVDGSVRVWNLTERTSTAAFPAHDGEVFAVRSTHHGGRAVAVTAGRDGAIRMWRLRAPAGVGIRPTGRG